MKSILVNHIFLLFLICLSFVVKGQTDSTKTDSVEINTEIEDELSNLFSTVVKEKTYKEDPVKFFDMAVYSTQKGFKSRKVKRHNLWEKIEHDCSLELGQVPNELNKAFNNIHRTNQSSLFDLIKGNVKISNQIIHPTERQIMHSPYLTPGSSSKIFSCLSGLSYREENFILNNADYFGIVLDNLKYLKTELKYSHHKNVHSYSAEIIRNKEDIPKILKDPTKLGLILSIGGGHSLGNYLYIEQ